MPGKAFNGHPSNFLSLQMTRIPDSKPSSKDKSLVVIKNPQQDSMTTHMTQ
jgi:hypothetical protein